MATVRVVTGTGKGVGEGEQPGVAERHEIAEAGPGRSSGGRLFDDDRRVRAKGGGD